MRFATYFLVGLCFLLLNDSTFGQGSDVQREGDAARMARFQSLKKSPTTAGIYSCLLTSSGHAYAGNWTRGLLFSLAKVGWMLMSDPGSSTIARASLTVCGAGLWIWEMVDAGTEVKKYNGKLHKSIFNRRLEPKFGIQFKPWNQKSAIGLCYNF